MNLLPTDTTYPDSDERFQLIPSDMSLVQCAAWTNDMPPSPEFNPAETYPDFTKRQTAYAAYRNAVVSRRDQLKQEERQLNIPRPPVGDDIVEAIKWVQSTGTTPLEFLTKTYRDSSNQMGHRIAAASKMMEYIHRRMPATVDHVASQTIPTAKQFDPTAIASLSVKELESLEKLLDKMSAKS